MMEGAMSNYGGMYLDPVYAQRKPTPADNQYRIDQEWVDESVAPHVVYKLVHIDWTMAPYPATWIPIGGSKLSLYEVTDPDTTLTAATMTAADDLVTTAAAHGVRNGQGLQFAGGGLPPELPPSPAVVYAVNVGLLTMQVSLVPGGAPINFSVNGAGNFNTVNGATSTPIVDFYDGSIITNTAATPDQTLEPPTDPTPGKTFIVNNDQSSTDPVNVIYEGALSVTLMPGQGQKFVWDGAKWVLGAGLDADDVDYVPHGEITEVTVQSAIDKLIDIRWHKRFYNATGGILAANKVVKLDGYDAGSTEAAVVLVTATADVPCGFLTAAIGIGVTGYAIIKGEHISVLDTSAGAVNDPVYFTAAGDLTLTPGSAVIGRVLTVGNPGTVYIDIPANATSGKLALNPVVDPALNAAVTTAIIDAFDGTVITLSAGGNSQTLAAPTDITAGKTFVVAVAPGVAFGIPVVHGDGTRWVFSGENASFIWDGTAWSLEGKKVNHTIATDPAVNAITVGIIDQYDGIDITLTGAGNSQTIPAPTDTRAGKRFWISVVTGVGYSIPIVHADGTRHLFSGEGIWLVWNGAGWAIDGERQVMDVATDPALNAATTTAIIDRYDGIVITLTAAGNSQTLSAPTDTRAGKEFSVAVLSGVVYGLPVVHADGTRMIFSGEHATFVWTGAEWNMKEKKLVFVPATDPALNAATTTAIINDYDGVVIALTAAGNSQTLSAPTAATKAKTFIVTVTGTSGAFSTPVVYGGGTIYIHAYESQVFVWDGAAWCIGTDTLFTDNGEYLIPKSTDRTIQAASTARVVTRTESGVIPAATTYTDIGLVVAAGHTVKDASVTAVNMALVARKVRIAHVAVGGAVNPPDVSAFVCYDFEMYADSCLGWNIPTIHAGEVIIVYADGADVTFRISGNDIAAVKSDQVSRLSIGAALADVFTATAGRHIEELKIVNRDVNDTVVTVYAKEAATAAAVDAICRFEIPGELWVTLRDLETYNIHLANAQKLSAIAAVAGRINIIVYAK